MRFEHITWHDIVVQSNWTDPESLTDIILIHSAGIYIDETDKQVRLAVAYGIDTDGSIEYNGIIAIPKGCIHSRNYLKPEGNQ